MAQYEKLINLSLLNQFLTKAKTIFAPKITASGILKGDGNGGVSAATAGTDYLAPNALTPYRTAAAQDVIDAGQNAQIAARAKADEIGIVITGKRPSMVVRTGQYVIVRGSTITAITDGLYTAVNALSPSTDVTAADLTAVSNGGLNYLKATRAQAGIQGWGTTLTINATHALVFVKHTLLISVWFAGTNDINVGVIVFQNSNIYVKGGIGSVTCGMTPEDTLLTFTRNGQSMTITSTSNQTMSFIAPNV